MRHIDGPRDELCSLGYQMAYFIEKLLYDRVQSLRLRISRDDGLGTAPAHDAARRSLR